MSVNKTTVIRWLKAHLVLVSCTGLGVVFGALAACRYDAAQTTATEIEEVQDKLDTMSRNVRAASGLAEDLARMKTYGARVDSTLMDKDAKAVNLAYFYETGAIAGVRVTRVIQNTVEPPSAGGGPDKSKVAPKKFLTSYDQIRFDVGVEGPFQAMLTYIDIIRAEHPLMRVDLISATPATNAPGRTEEASLVITVLTTMKGSAK